MMSRSTVTFFMFYMLPERALRALTRSFKLT